MLHQFEVRHVIRHFVLGEDYENICCNGPANKETQELNHAISTTTSIRPCFFNLWKKTILCNRNMGQFMLTTLRMKYKITDYCIPGVVLTARAKQDRLFQNNTDFLHLQQNVCTINHSLSNADDVFLQNDQTVKESSTEVVSPPFPHCEKEINPGCIGTSRTK
jgi:hypothetical protein